MHKLIVCLLLSGLFFSCSRIKEVQCTDIKGFKVHKVNTEGIDSDVMLTIKNPNKVGFYIYPSEFNVAFSGIKLGKARLKEKVFIPKNSEQTYPFTIAGDFKDITLGDIMKVLEAFSRTGELEVKGNLNVGKFLVKKSFPVELKEKISVE